MGASLERGCWSRFVRLPCGDSSLGRQRYEEGEITSEINPCCPSRSSIPWQDSPATVQPNPSENKAKRW